MNSNGFPHGSNPFSPCRPSGLLVPRFPKLTDGFKASSPVGSGIVTTDPTKWSNLADWPDGCETSSTESSPARQIEDEPVPKLVGDSDDDCNSVSSEESGEWDDLVAVESVTSDEDLRELQNNLISTIHRFEVNPESPPPDDIVANPSATNSLTIFDPIRPTVRFYSWQSIPIKEVFLTFRSALVFIKRKTLVKWVRQTSSRNGNIYRCGSHGDNCPASKYSSLFLLNLHM